MTPTEKAIREIINRRVQEWLHPYTHVTAPGMRPAPILVDDDDNMLASSPAAMIFKELERFCTDLTPKSEYKNSCAYCGRPAHAEHGE